jgi:hypothetical protein
MHHHEFEIGEKFTVLGTRDMWLCTDKGTRVVVAINLSQHVNDPRDFAGPPYSVAEMVFDEYDIEACSLPQQQREGGYR